MAGQRLAFIDYARVLATFLVIFGHLYGAASPERLYIYAFHMPFFFLISGLFHKHISITRWIKNGTRSLLIPTTFFMLVMSIHRSIYFNTNFIHDLTNRFYSVIRDPHDMGITWFLLALFWVKLFAIAFVKSPKFNLTILTLALLHIPFLTYARLGLAYGFMGLPFYLIGMKFKNQIISFCQRRYAIIIGMILLTLSFFITQINGRISMVRLNYGDAIYPLNILLFYCNGLIGSIALLCLCSLFNKRNSIIEDISTSLITVVGLQYVFVDAISKYIGLDTSYLFTIPTSIIIILSCNVAHIIFIKYAPYLVGK